MKRAVIGLALAAALCSGCGKDSGVVEKTPVSAFSAGFQAAVEDFETAGQIKIQGDGTFTFTLTEPETLAQLQGYGNPDGLVIELEEVSIAGSSSTLPTRSVGMLLYQMMDVFARMEEEGQSRRGEEAGVFLCEGPSAWGDYRITADSESCLPQRLEFPEQEAWIQFASPQASS